MPVLHIEEVPADLYDRLRRRAAVRSRELKVEVLDLLERALATEEESRAAHAAALADLRGQRWSPPRARRTASPCCARTATERQLTGLWTAGQ